MADIFVSYTSSDREWAQWIAFELEALTHVAHVHEWEIKGGDDIYGWMEQHIDGADHVLCVVSDAYLTAPYSTLERRAALWQAAKNKPGFVLLVAVKPCKLPTLSDHIRRCELFGVPDEAARLRFRVFMEGAGKPETAAFPGKVFAVSNIPIRVPEIFLGRDEALEAIDAALKRGEGRVAIAALYGLRGVGKTVLAAAYAERRRAGYRATWWLRAQTPDGLRADLVALGVRLGWVPADAKEAEALQTVSERLRDEGEGILLIYDNAIDAASLAPYLPPGGAACAIVTSNAHDWRKVAAPIEIEVWPRDIGAEYLIARAGRERDRPEAEALSDTLGGLPLAHEQAGAYCARLEIPFGEYSRRFAAAPARFLDDSRHAPVEHNDGMTVAKSFALAIDEAAKLHPAAEPLIVHAALLAPEPIPLFLFSEGREKLGDPLASLLAGDGLDEAVAALRAFALVDRETIPDERDPALATDTIRLHRLVREVAAGRVAGEAREATRWALIEAMRAVYPADVFDNPSAWPRARRLDPLAVDLVAGRGALPTGAEAAAGYILDALGRYRQGALAAYASSRPLYERALAIYEKALGPEHRDTAGGLNNLAVTLYAQGDLAAARPLFERSQSIREKALGPEHPETATGLNNLAMLLKAQGDLAGARSLHERALAIRETAGGPEHPDTATSLNNLALLLEDQGDLAGARPLYERALAIREKALGSEHPDTATSLNNLALLLRAQGDLAGARPLLERALAIRERVLGPEHPDTAASLNNLAAALRDLGEFTESARLFGRAIAISKATLGPTHALTGRFQANYARQLLLTGQSKAALPLAEEALAVHEAASGASHPWTKDAAAVKADALDALGRAGEGAEVRAKYGIVGAPVA